MLWNHKHITINNEPFTWNRWLDNGVVYIKDLLDDQGSFMDHSSIHRTFGIQCNFLESLQIRHGIPLTWRGLLTRHENQCANCDIVDDVYVRINNKKVPISQSETKLFYQYFIAEKSQLPVCIEKWKEIYPEIKNEEWNEIFKHPFRITRETKLQTFQYKIIHRIINCNKKLYDMKIKNDTNLFIL